MALIFEKKTEMSPLESMFVQSGVSSSTQKQNIESLRQELNATLSYLKSSEGRLGDPSEAVEKIKQFTKELNAIETKLSRTEQVETEPLGFNNQ